MDLVRLKLHVGERTCQVVLSEAAGQVPGELSGAAFDRVLAAAEPLLVRLAQEGGGPVQHLSLDLDPDHESLTVACMKQPDELPTDADERKLLHRHGASMGEVGEVPSHLASLHFTGEAYRHLLSLLRELVKVAQREAHPRVPDPPGLSAAEAWEHKYQSGGDGWELMRPAPPLSRHLTAHPPLPGALALVPGCGRGHEARLLAAAGARVVAVDLAPSALAEARRLSPSEGPTIEWRLADFLTLPADPGERGRYDLVVEHCCYCAIDPDRRDEYVQTVAALLRPGGRYVGLFWCFQHVPGRAGGPPFPATRQEIRDRLAPRFTLVHDETPHDSVLARSGQEYLLDLILRPN